MGKVDILIKNARVIDPYRKIDEVGNIAIKGRKIVSAENAVADNTIDASGCIVTPGLIDFHCHVGAFVSELGVAPETTYFPTGVTTVVDAGTTGTANYEALRMLTTICRLRIKAFLNVCPAGLVTTAYHEDLNPVHFRKEKMLELFEKYPDQLLGVKIRSSKELVGEFGTEPLRAALDIAETAGVPLVVHTTNPPIKPEELASMLRPGDVYAHVYNGKGNTVLRDGQVIEAMREHQRRGVVMDAANGVNHFGLAVAKACIAQNFLPDIISTDLSSKSVYSPGMVFSLPYILSKYIALGLPLPEIIKRATTAPAAYLGAEKELGSLEKGTCADITIHRLVEKKEKFRDFFCEVVEGSQLLKTEMTIRDGQTVFRQIDF